jgi:glycerol kinase
MDDSGALTYALEGSVFVTRATGLGAAFLVGLASGHRQDELAATWQLDRRFEPGPRDDAAHERWREAVRRSLGWARHD